MLPRSVPSLPAPAPFTKLRGSLEALILPQSCPWSSFLAMAQTVSGYSLNPAAFHRGRTGTDRLVSITLIRLNPGHIRTSNSSERFQKSSLGISRVGLPRKEPRYYSLEDLGAGDELVVTRIDRLARSIGDLQDIVRALKANGATLRALQQPIRPR